MRKHSTEPSMNNDQVSYSLSDLFKVTQNGRLKSTLMLYSFSMAFVILAIYIGAYLLLLRPLDSLLSSNLPLQVINWIEGLVPALLATFICTLLQFRIRERRMIPFSFMWLILIVIPTLLILLTMLEEEDRLLYFSIVSPMVLLPLAVGMATSLIIFFRFRHQNKVDPSEGRT